MATTCTKYCRPEYDEHSEGCIKAEAHGGYDPENCKECSWGKLVSHNGSPRCRSGSIASGGTRAHCTCDTCY